MTDFGAGPLLTRDLDFSVTTTGDIETTSEIRELEKDIAFRSLIQLQAYEGMTQTPRTKVLIKSGVNQTLTNDPRIDNVLDIQVTYLDQNNTAEIVASVTTDNSDQDLVFEV